MENFRRNECTYPGRDDLVKVVDVRVEDKVLRRPISRIPPPLEIATVVN